MEPIIDQPVVVQCCATCREMGARPEDFRIPEPPRGFSYRVKAQAVHRNRAKKASGQAPLERRVTRYCDCGEKLTRSGSCMKCALITRRWKREEKQLARKGLA